MRERLAGVGCEPYKASAEQFAAQLRADTAKWSRIVKDSGAKLD